MKIEIDFKKFFTKIWNMKLKDILTFVGKSLMALIFGLITMLIVGIILAVITWFGNWIGALYYPQLSAKITIVVIFIVFYVIGWLNVVDIFEVEKK